MSRENVELIRGMLETFNESGDLERFWELADPDVVLEIATQEGRESPDFRVHRGLDEVKAAMTEMLEPFDRTRVDVHECVDAGGELVVCALELQMRPKGSAAEISTGKFAYVYTVRDGRIVRVQDFPDPAEGFRAAGVTGRTA